MTAREKANVRRSAQKATYYVTETDSEIEVPSYVVISGSVNDAAEMLGLRVLSRRETSTEVCAELHGPGMDVSFWAVKR